MAKAMDHAKNVFAKIYRDLGTEFTYALDDVRQKVIEQGWFGQRLTPELTTSVELPSAYQEPQARDLYGPAQERDDKGYLASLGVSCEPREPEPEIDSEPEIDR